MNLPLRLVILWLVICLPSGWCRGAWLQDPKAAVPAAGQQVEQRLELADGQSMEYLLFLPGDYSPGSPAPLLLFLHGRGESHGPLALVAKWGPPQMAAAGGSLPWIAGGSLPWIIVSPQCPADDSWSSEQQQTRLVALLDHIVQKYTVDTDRICLTGLSMGGYGSWKLAAGHSGRFAAVVPVCGGGDPDRAERLVALPIWVWHGAEDAAVPFQHSVEMVEAVRAAGGTRIRFTGLEHVGHNSWSSAYGTPELWSWMEQQRVSTNAGR